MEPGYALAYNTGRLIGTAAVNYGAYKLRKHVQNKAMKYLSAKAKSYFNGNKKHMKRFGNYSATKIQSAFRGYKTRSKNAVKAWAMNLRPEDRFVTMPATKYLPEETWQTNYANPWNFGSTSRPRLKAQMRLANKLTKYGFYKRIRKVVRRSKHYRKATYKKK